MTFCTRVKDELGGLPIKAACCRKAFLYGLLLRAEVPAEGEDIRLTLPVLREASTDLTALAVSLIRQTLGREAAVTTETRGAHRYAHVAFSSRQAAGTLRRLAASGDLSVEDLSGLLNFRCASCASHFLRGAFLSGGTVNHPDKSVHLEYRLPDDGRADAVTVLWQSEGILPGVSTLGTERRLVCKSGQALQDVLAYLGATHILFDILNIQLTHDVRKQENRATNWEAANIRRSVGAGSRHLAAIRGLKERSLLASLPEEVRETAELRVLHPEMSLSELAECHTPPITKSGLNHRLEKILAAWEKAGGHE